MHRLCHLLPFAIKTSGKVYPLVVCHFQIQVTVERLRIRTLSVTPPITLILKATGDYHRVDLLNMSEEHIDHQNKRGLDPFLITKYWYVFSHFQPEDHLCFSCGGI